VLLPVVVPAAGEDDNDMPEETKELPRRQSAKNRPVSVQDHPGGGPRILPVE